MRWTSRRLVLPVIVISPLWLGNSSALLRPFATHPSLLAHRGVHQNYAHEGVRDDTCTATHIIPVRHNYIEDTLPSMAAAFQEGADAVDFDVHLTTDARWAVFHDWNLECRTNGHGATAEHTLAYLKSLDLGYGYTADGGKTYPLRGKGVGLLPSLNEVLTRFPEKHFILHIKSNDPREGETLGRTLLALPPGQRQMLAVTGGDLSIATLRSNVPDIETMSPKSIKRCVLQYIALGETGYVPHACRNTVLFVPVNVAPWLWGWPNRFLRRMDAAGTRVFAVDDYKAGGTKGLNDRTDFKKLPKGYTGGIWTDQIEKVMAERLAHSF
jgi:glycerophosphoryl diester phosphodiesterase